MEVNSTLKINYKMVNYPKKVGNVALPNAARRVVDVGVRAAKTSYMNQRKAGGPSAIISSFTDKIDSLSGGRVIGFIQVGGPQAPYAVWVNFGHRLRDGSWWEGYHFMENGGNSPPGAMTAMKQSAGRIMNEELRKISV